MLATPVAYHPTKNIVYCSARTEGGEKIHFEIPVPQLSSVLFEYDVSEFADLVLHAERAIPSELDPRMLTAVNPQSSMGGAYQKTNGRGPLAALCAYYNIDPYQTLLF